MAYENVICFRWDERWGTRPETVTELSALPAEVQASVLRAHGRHDAFAKPRIVQYWKEKAPYKWAAPEWPALYTAS